MADDTEDIDMGDLPAVEEDADETPDEVLDWLCWVWATEAERLYPPDEAAEDMAEAEIEAIVDADLTDDDLEERKEQAFQHFRVGYTRSLATDRVRFHDLERRGFDPKSRADREVARTHAEGHELPEIDWTWYDETLGGDE